MVLRAQQLADEFTGESMAAALGHIEQALAIDPSYAAAMALAAYCRAERVSQGWTQDLEAEAKEGLRLASRAIELLAKTMAMFFGWLHMQFSNCKWNTERAKELAYHSLQLNPNSAIALAMAGRTETHTGNATKALELLFRAERLSPREPRGWFITIGIAAAYMNAGRFDEGISACRRALNQNPGNAMVLRMLAASLVIQGQQNEALQVGREVLAIEPQLTLTNLRARGAYVDKTLANKILAALRVVGIPE